MLLELLIGLAAVLLFWDYLKRRRRNQVFADNGMRGPSLLPLIGGAHHFARETPETVFKMLNRFTAQFGRTWCTWVLHESVIVTSDARMIEAILSSQQVITKNRLYDLLHSWLGSGLLMSTGKKWHQRRKIITPTFHFKILEQFVEVFDQQSAIMVKQLCERADGKTVVNIFPNVCLTALDIIAETAMGVKVNAQLDPDFPYVKSVTTVAKILAVRFIKPLQRFETLMRLTVPGEFKKMQQNIKLMHDFTDNVIRERRVVLEKSIADCTYKPMTEVDGGDGEVGSKKRMALLDVLLQSTVNGSSLTNQDIREEVDTFMFEGHDTTTSGISYTLYLIARHPEVQQKLCEEIRAVIGDDKHQAVTMRQLQDLKYLECVIKESLRLYPPVPMIGRFVSEDIVLNGKLFPANCNILVLIYAALRDPAYFSDPDSFKPERFSAESAEKIDPFANVPFSAGPRNCIGQKFAILEMKSTISKMLRHFELLPLGEPVRPLMNIILRSENGMNLGLKPRVY